MKQYKPRLRGILAEYADTFRRTNHLTQEEMAERLRITSRAYGDLERGKYCFSTPALLFLLLLLNSDEVTQLLETVREVVVSSEPSSEEH